MKKLAYEIFDNFQNEITGDFNNVDRSKVIDFYKDIRMALFLNYYKKDSSVDDVNKLLTDSMIDLADALKNTSYNHREILDKFYLLLSEIRVNLLGDVTAIYNGDPSCNSLSEVILTYPGFIAISAYRIAHALYELSLKSVARIISEYAHSRTGIDINPGAQIGKNFFIDHGTGIVIGETCVIGNNVKIYQGVTLGAMSLKKGQSLRGTKRHPTIEDDVTIYSGASIFGGDTIIGKGSTIGSSSYITKSIPNYSIVKNKPCDIEVTSKVVL